MNYAAQSFVRFAIVLFYFTGSIYAGAGAAQSLLSLDELKQQIDVLSLESLRDKSVRSTLNLQCPLNERKNLKKYFDAREEILDREKLLQREANESAAQKAQSFFGTLLDELVSFKDNHLYGKKFTPINKAKVFQSLINSISRGNLKAVALMLYSYNHRETEPEHLPYEVSSLPTSLEGLSESEKKHLRDLVITPFKAEVESLLHQEFESLSQTPASQVTPDRKKRLFAVLNDEVSSTLGVRTRNASPFDRASIMHSTLLNDAAAARQAKVRQIIGITSSFGFSHLPTRSFSPEHICEGSSGSGKHYFESPYELDYSMIEPSRRDGLPVFQNLQTGVLLGFVSLFKPASPGFSPSKQEIPKKISTIFPMGFTKDELITTLEGRLRPEQEYARGVRRDGQQAVSLYKFSLHGTSMESVGPANPAAEYNHLEDYYMVESVAQNDGDDLMRHIVLDTIYPIFSYTKISQTDLDNSPDEVEFILATMVDLTNESAGEEYLTITAGELKKLLSQAAGAVRGCYLSSMRRFDGAEVMIVDVGPYLAEKGQLRGLRSSVYVEIYN